MQFRNKKDLNCCILKSIDELELKDKVESFGKSVIFEDLQYSTTTKENGQIEYSVFIIYNIIKGE